MTSLDTYQPPAAPGQYQAGTVMTPESAKALDDQVRRCTEAVLREGTDYGTIPGTGVKTLWRPGAQKLLQWFGLGFTCERVDIERDDDGRKHGITYRATVARRLPDGTLDIKATCEGTADYDETKFYQTEEQVRARLRELEHKYAAKDRRAPNADRWNSAKEYRADWNALMKRAQKRAIVGAVVDATAAGGIFTDREEDDTAAPEDGGPSWYEEALEAAHAFTDIDDGRRLYVDAAQAHRNGLCTRRQQDHIQNTVTKRVKLLQSATVVEAEDLARRAGETAAAGDDTRTQSRGQAPRDADRTAQDADPRAAGAAPDRGAQPLPPPPGDDDTDYDTPGTVTGPQLTAIWTVLTGVYKFTDDEKDQARAVCAHITRRPLDTTTNMSRNEAGAVLDTLASWQETARQHDEPPRGFLIELLATAENAEASDA